MRDLTYPAVIRTALVLFKGLGLRFQMSGTEHVPREGGALLAFNHVSYVDFVLGGFAAHPSGRLVRFMAKKDVFEHAVSGPLMRGMKHIPVDRAAGADAYRAAVEALQRGELIGVFPETTISRSLPISASSSRTSPPCRSATAPRSARASSK